MAYATKYRVEFTNAKLQEVKIDLQVDGFGGSVTNLVCSGASLEYPDGDRSKNTGLRSSSLSFQVQCTDSLPSTTFITSSDTEVKVLLYYNGTLNWSGWLDSSGYQSPLLDGKYFVNLVARDGLHLLQEKKLQNLSDADFWGERSIKDLIAYCLDKTDLGLGFWTWIDIYPESVAVRGAGGDTLGANDPLGYAYVHSLTFQQGVKAYDNPYEVLQKICQSFNLTAFQARGEWHFVYLEDWIRNVGLTGTQWNASGTALQYQSAQRHRMDVGLYQSHKFINNDALLTWQKLFKSAKTKYSFDIPPSLIRNLDLSESVVSFSTAGFFYGSLTHWTTTSGTDPKVYVITDATSLETNRYIRVDLAASASSRFKCTAFPVNVNDKFKFSNKVSIGGNNQFVISFRAYNTLGSYYLKPDGKWQVGGTALFHAFSSNAFSDLSFETVEGIPTSGYMEITMGYTNTSGSLTSVGIISDMKFEYEGRIGTNILAKGHYYKSEQTAVSKLAYEEETYICDSQNKVFQGALVNSAGVLTGVWKHNGVTESVRFGLLINRAIWKSVYRNYIRIEGNILNLNEGSYLVSPLNTIIPDALEDTEFNIATLNIDLDKEQAEGTFIELVNTLTTDDFDEIASLEEFRYIDFAELKEFTEPKPERQPPPFYYGAIGLAVYLIQKKKKKKS